MRNKKCRICGCRSFKADRALAGRLICQDCGTPEGHGNRKIHSGSLSIGKSIGFHPLTKIINKPFSLIVIGVL